MSVLAMEQKIIDCIGPTGASTSTITHKMKIYQHNWIYRRLIKMEKRGLVYRDPRYPIWSGIEIRWLVKS